MRTQLRSIRRHRERGQSLLLLAVCVPALLAVAALSIDLVTLYVARGQAQAIADAAALAGARVFVNSGFTSGQLGSPASASAQGLVCTGGTAGTGMLDQQVQSVAGQNKIFGTPPTHVATACDFSVPLDPRVTVTVSRLGLPTFFSRIWGQGAGHVTAVAKAEAFNPSGSSINISVPNIKPWLVANCNPFVNGGSLLGLCPSNPPFLDPSNNYAIVNPGSFLGQELVLRPGPLTTTSLLGTYYSFAVPITAAAASCPSPSAQSCGSLDAANPGFFETVACSNSYRIRCGPTPTPGLLGNILGLNLLQPDSVAPAMCLIHSAGGGLGQGQDVFASSSLGSPYVVSGGDSNPDPALRGAISISRTDSVVTVPLWDGNPLCPGALCQSFNIVGFMQLGITEVDPPVLGLPVPTLSAIRGRILNIAGCGAAATGAAPVVGVGDSPIPVRLVQ